MKKLALIAVAAFALSGCTVHERGSQAVTINPFNMGSDDPVFSPADDGYHYVDGEPWNYR